jgi:pimeloyl-ACP methyl ester carboxylesterase
MTGLVRPRLDASEGTALAAADDMITRVWQRSVRRELSALATATASTPWTLFLRDETFNPTAPHPTPVVLIHGLFGSASNFLSLRRVLTRRGVSNVHSFSYIPGIDVLQVAHRLGAAIEGICAATRSKHVDVVGHSLGGLVARHLTELPAGRMVRRLVTLGAPYFTTRLAPQELAIFAARDALISPPPPNYRASAGHTRVVPDCGHLGLLYHPGVLRRVALHLARPARPKTARAGVARLRQAPVLPAGANLAIA